MTGNVIKKDLGQQPLAGLMTKHDLKPHALVAVSDEQLTHKMVARAARGRRLTPNVKKKVLHSLNKAAGAVYLMADLFDY